MSDAEHAGRPGEAEPLPQGLGRYHVLGRLGMGGMGVVLSAYDPNLDRKVALKLLRTDGGSGSSDRLLREAHALARLSHPNVVQIYDAGKIGGQIFIAMELIQGVDLRAWLVEPRPVAEVLRVFRDAGLGLAAAHDAGFVHRDFKPENVLLGTDGRARIVDFGLVRQPDEELAPANALQSHTIPNGTLTRTGARLGTPVYMSPEQHRGHPADARSDQFSFCVALWEALYRQRPFSGRSIEAVVAAVLDGRIEPPVRNTRTPRFLIRVLERGMSVAPEHRYRDMSSLLLALAHDPARIRRRWLLGVGMTGLLAAALMVVRGNADAPCAGGPDELATTWNMARRQTVVEALAELPDPAQAALVLAGLDRYANAWLTSHRDACLAHVRGEQSSDLLDARMLCLDRRRQALAAAAQLLAAGDAEPAEPGAPTPGPPDVAQLVARLPQIDACDDPAVVLGEAAVPDDPRVAGELASVHALQISARASHDAGDLRTAQAAVDAAVARARRAGFQPALAEALLNRGRILFTRTDWDGARPALAEAVNLAIEARRDDIAAEAMARMLYVDGVHHGHPSEALRLESLALALAARAPDPYAARGLLYNNLGVAHTLLNHVEAARTSMHRGLAEMLKSPRPDPIELAHATFNAAASSVAPEDRRAGMAHAIDILVDNLGPRHRLAIVLRYQSGYYANTPREGIAALQTTCPEFLRVLAGRAGTCEPCYQVLGSLEMYLGDPARALASAEQGLACDPAISGYYPRDRTLAFLAVHNGRANEALVHVKRALLRLEPERHRAWVAAEIAQFELLGGRALLDLGRPAEAAAMFERIIPIFAGGQGYAPLLPDLSLAEAETLLARALLAVSPPDPGRAAELRAKADASFTRLGAGPP